jgi:hypothetical protein
LVGRIWKSELVVTEGRKNGRKVENIVGIIVMRKANTSVVKHVPVFFV